jgi:hypothetical protein
MRKGRSGVQQLDPCTAVAAAMAAAATSSTPSAAAGWSSAAQAQQLRQQQQQLAVPAIGMCHRSTAVLQHIQQPLSVRGPLLHATTLRVDLAAAAITIAEPELISAGLSAAAAHASSNSHCRVPTAFDQQGPVLTALPVAPATPFQVLLQHPASKHCQASLWTIWIHIRRNIPCQIASLAAPDLGP